MLLIKPKNTSFYKLRLKSNLSFLRFFLVDQSIRLMKESINGLKDCSWSISCLAVAAEIMICHAEDVRKFYSTTWSRKDNKLSKKLLTFNKPIGFWWMFSWPQEEIWNISSNVTRSSGKAMKASAWSNIVSIRLDIVETSSSSPNCFSNEIHFC